MSLVDNFKVPCTLLERSRVPDGEGGWTTGWADGPTFQAAIVRNSSLAARVAEREGLTNVYTVTTSPTRRWSSTTCSGATRTGRCSA